MEQVEISLPRVLWSGTHPIIEVERGRSRSLVIIRERKKPVMIRFLGIEKVDREYRTTFLDRPEPTPLVDAAKSFLQSARIKPNATQLLQRIIMQFDQSVTPSQIRASLVSLLAANPLPEGHKLATAPERFRDREAALKRYAATEQAIEDAKNPPKGDEGGQAIGDDKRAMNMERAAEVATDAAAESSGDSNTPEATTDNTKGTEMSAAKKPARKAAKPKAKAPAKKKAKVIPIDKARKAKAAGKPAAKKKAAKVPAKKAAKAPAKRKSAPRDPDAPKRGRKPTFGMDQRFFAKVSEDDVRIMDASSRTAVFRVIAKVPSRGATLEQIIAGSGLDEATVRSSLRHLMAAKRVEPAKAKK